MTWPPPLPGANILFRSGADFWVVQKDTLSPYVEPSSIYDDVWRAIRGIPGFVRTANVTYFSMQVRQIMGLIPSSNTFNGYMAGSKVWGHYVIIAPYMHEAIVPYNLPRFFHSPNSIGPERAAEQIRSLIL